MMIKSPGIRQSKIRSMADLSQFRGKRVYGTVSD